jgi:hypothetical protein
MSTSQSSVDGVVLETRYVWGKTLASAMGKALAEEKNGWKIQGNPAPMIYNGCYGTGVSITRINDV